MFNHTIIKNCIHNWKFDFIKNLASLCIYVVETNLSSKRIHLKNAVILQNINGLFNLYILCIWFTTYYLLTYIPNLWKQIVQIVSYLSLAQFFCWTVSDEMLFKIATCPYTFTLESGINVTPLINLAPGKCGKKKKRSPIYIL